MNLENAATEPTARRSIRLKWIFRLIGVIILLFGGQALWTFLSGRAALQEAIEATDAIDPRWRFEDIEADRAVIPDAENSALVMIAAYKLLEPRTKPSEVDSEIVSATSRFPNHRLNDVENAALAAINEYYVTALPEYLKVASMVQGRFPIPATPDINSFPKVFPYANQCASALYYDMLRLLEAGDIPASCDRLKAINNCCRSFGDEPYTMAILTRCGIRSRLSFSINRLLAQSQPTSQMLINLQWDLEKENTEPLLLMYSRGSRAEVFEMLESTTANLPENGPQRFFAALLGGADFGIFTRMKAFHLNSMNHHSAIIKKPSHEQFVDLIEWEQHAKSKNVFSLMHPGVKSTLGIHRSQAVMTCTITAIACERFRQDNNRWPDNFGELVDAKLLDTIPIDPFDGKPLRWKQIDGGRVVYSIGQDRVDNEGKQFDKYPGEPQTDVVFQLFDPAHRRLPPLEVKAPEPAKP